MKAAQTETTALQATPDREWRDGWKLVLATGLGGSVVAFYSVALGSLMKPIAAETGWGRGQISLSILMVNGGAALFSPFVGALADRNGARRVVLPGIILYVLALAAVSLTGGPIWTWYLAFGAMAVIIAGVEPPPWTMALTSRFTRHRGMALGISMAGLGVAIGAIPIFASTVQAAVGWRMTYVALAALVFVTAFPLSWFFFYDARDLARRRRIAAPTEAVVASPALPGLTLKEALRTGRFWRLLLGMFICAVGPGTFMVHLQPMLTDAGVSVAKAAGIASFIGLFTVVGRLAGGYLLDRIWAPLVASGAFLLLAVASIVMFNYDGSTGPALFIASAVGLSLGVEIDMLAYLASRYFGLKAYGSIVGIFFGAFAIGFGFSSLAAGSIYDYVKSYQPLTAGLAVALVCGSALILSLGRYPKFAAPDQTGAGAP